MSIYPESWSSFPSTSFPARDSLLITDTKYCLKCDGEPRRPNCDQPSRRRHGNASRSEARQPRVQNAQATSDDRKLCSSFVCQFKGYGEWREQHDGYGMLLPDPSLGDQEHLPNHLASARRMVANHFVGQILPTVTGTRGPCEKFYFFAFVECDLARLQRVFKSDVRAEREIQGAPAALIASGLCEVFLDHGA
jgi:hypothetical protein